VRTLTLSGEVQSEAQIMRHENHSVYERFSIKFSPDGNHFLTDIEGKIYRLGLGGHLTLMHPASHSGLWTPSYHPEQTKFAATFGIKDFDIGYLKLQTEGFEFDVVSRSTAPDINAKFQPNGALIAFISVRSGQRQIWIIDGENTYQLTKFKDGLKSTRYDWAPDGKSLVINVNNKVTLVNLDGSSQTVESPVAVRLIMPWTIPHKLLLIDNQADKQQLFDIDLNTGKTTTVNIDRVIWAAYSKDEQIVYVDQQGNFGLYSPEETKVLSLLNNKLDGDYVLLKDNTLYGMDAQPQLWRYDLNTHEFKNIATLDKDTTYVTDIRGDKILATKFIGGRRELVEFSRQ